MSSIDDGGPVHPNEYSMDIRYLGDSKAARQAPGLTIRDYFAAKAMEGMVSCCPQYVDVECLSKDAYKVADAMLVARLKNPRQLRNGARPNKSLENLPPLGKL